VEIGTREAEERVELHRREGRAESGHERGAILEAAALVVGADDEHAHVVAARGFEGGGVELVDEVPVQVDVVELAGVDRGQDDVGGGVRGEADEAHAALALETAGDFEAAAGAHGPVEELLGVDAVKREEVDVFEAEVGEGLFEGLEKLGGIFGRGDLGLHEHLVARQAREDAAELHLGGAVAAGCFDVIDAAGEGALDAGFEVGLVGGGDVGRGDVLPLVLVAHAAAGEDGHGELGAAETTIDHAARKKGEERRGKGENFRPWA